MLDTEIGRHHVLSDLQIDEPHPHFKKIRPVWKVCQERMDDDRAGREKHAGRRDDAAGRIRFDVEIFLRNITGEGRSRPQKTEHPDKEEPAHPSILTDDRIEQPLVDLTHAFELPFCGESLVESIRAEFFGQRRPWPDDFGKWFMGALGIPVGD